MGGRGQNVEKADRKKAGNDDAFRSKRASTIATGGAATAKVNAKAVAS
jgi:hypothetical protein